jgi:hypothetical protein
MLNSGGDIYPKPRQSLRKISTIPAGKFKAQCQFQSWKLTAFLTISMVPLAFADSTVLINAANNILNVGGSIISIQNTDLVSHCLTLQATSQLAATLILRPQYQNNADVTLRLYLLTLTNGGFTNNLKASLVSEHL